MVYHDAHCHLQAQELQRYLPQIAECYHDLPMGEVVVNGTCEADWDQVAELADRFSFVRPAFGVHPWKTKEVSEEWLRRLSEKLDRYPNAGLGEVGLDRWVKDYDLPLQEKIFRSQLEVARERKLPVSVHCLQAWGKTLEVLKEFSGDSFRFLLHSYSGSEEMIGDFSGIGGYFSISGYFSLDRKAKQREALRQIPMERLLIETDAPEMGGDKRYMLYSLDGDEEINHPGNIEGVYQFASELFDLSVEELAKVVDENYQRFWARD